MTPSRIGLMAVMVPGVRPTMAFASVPTASILSFTRLTATMEGSLSTMPWPRANTQVFAVPRSMARSFEKIANVPNTEASSLKTVQLHGNTRRCTATVALCLPFYRRVPRKTCVVKARKLMANRDRTSGDDDRMDLDDPLGIAREPVARDDRIRASSDEDSARRRRRRALGEDVEESDLGLGDLDDDP